MNLKLRNLENAIIGLINEAELPIEISRLVLSEIYGKVEKQATETILEEMKEKPEPIVEEGEYNAEST